MNRPAGKHVNRLETSNPVADEVPDSAYAEFGCWLDAELEKLVARWIHLAAPAAGSGRGRITQSAPDADL